MEKFALIVDDDEDLGRLLQLVLSKNGLTTSHVKSITELRDTVATTRPHVVFIDNRLDGGFGIDEVPAIRRMHPACRIILMTADDWHEIKNADGIKEIDGFMSKPFSTTDVEKHLSAAA